MSYKRGGAGDGTFCLWSTPQCRALCLTFSGQNAADPYNEGVKQAKSAALFRKTEEFCRVLLAAIHVFTCAQPCLNRIGLVRLNVYSDLPWELIFPGMFSYFEDTQFYDYTKVPGRRPPPNYDLTFSYSGTEENIAHSKSAIDDGRRLAVVFLLPKGEKRFPDTFSIGGDRKYRLPVFDGSDYDARPLDPFGIVIGLRYRPPGKKKQRISLRGKARIFVVPCVVDDDGTVVTAQTPRATEVRDVGEDVD